MSLIINNKDIVNVSSQIDNINSELPHVRQLSEIIQNQGDMKPLEGRVSKLAPEQLGLSLANKIIYFVFWMLNGFSHLNLEKAYASGYEGVVKGSLLNREPSKEEIEEVLRMACVKKDFDFIYSILDCQTYKDAIIAEKGVGNALVQRAFQDAFISSKSDSLQLREKPDLECILFIKQMLERGIKPSNPFLSQVRFFKTALPDFLSQKNIVKMMESLRSLPQAREWFLEFFYSQVESGADVSILLPLITPQDLDNNKKALQQFLIGETAPETQINFFGSKEALLKKSVEAGVFSADVIYKYKAIVSLENRITLTNELIQSALNVPPELLEFSQDSTFNQAHFVAYLMEELQENELSDKEGVLKKAEALVLSSLEKGETDVVLAFLDKGVSPNLTNADGNSLLSIARLKEKQDLMNKILSLPSFDFSKALMAAFEHKNSRAFTAIVLLCIEKGWNWDIATQDGSTIVMKAFQEGDPAWINQIIDLYFLPQTRQIALFKDRDQAPSPFKILCQRGLEESVVKILSRFSKDQLESLSRICFPAVLESIQDADTKEKMRKILMPTFLDKAEQDLSELSEDAAKVAGIVKGTAQNLLTKAWGYVPSTPAWLGTLDDVTDGLHQVGDALEERFFGKVIRAPISEVPDQPVLYSDLALI